MILKDECVCQDFKEIVCFRNKNRLAMIQTYTMFVHLEKEWRWIYDVELRLWVGTIIDDAGKYGKSRLCGSCLALFKGA